MLAFELLFFDGLEKSAGGLLGNSSVNFIIHAESSPFVIRRAPDLSLSTEFCQWVVMSGVAEVRVVELFDDVLTGPSELSFGVLLLRLLRCWVLIAETTFRCGETSRAGGVRSLHEILLFDEILHAFYLVLHGSNGGRDGFLGRVVIVGVGHGEPLAGRTAEDWRFMHLVAVGIAQNMTAIGTALHLVIGNRNQYKS
jgi:hypothetical protein